MLGSSTCQEQLPSTSSSPYQNYPLYLSLQSQKIISVLAKKKKKFVNSKELEDLHYFLNKINKFELSIGFCKYFFDSLEKKIDSIIKRNLRQHKDLKGMKMKIYNEILIQSGLCDNSNILLIFEVYRRIENLGEFGRGKEFRRGRFFNIEAMVNFYGFFFESNSLLI